MQETIRQLLLITEQVHRVEHAIAIIQPRLDDLQRAQIIGEKYINETKITCEAAEHGLVYTKEIELQILELSACPGRNDFLINLTNPLDVQGWWHNLTVTTRHEGGTARPWRQEIINAQCPGSNTTYCADAIASAIWTAGVGANGKPPFEDPPPGVQDYGELVDGLAVEDKGYVPTFAPWGARFGMYNSFWQKAYPGTAHDFTGEVGYEFRAATSFKISALGRSAKGGLAQVATVTLWDTNNNPLKSVEVGPTSDTIRDANGTIAYAYEELPAHYQVVKGYTYRITLACLPGMEFNSGNAGSLPEEDVATHYAVLGNSIFRDSSGTWIQGSLQDDDTVDDQPVVGGNAGVVNFFVEYGGSGYRPDLGAGGEAPDSLWGVTG